VTALKTIKEAIEDPDPPDLIDLYQLSSRI
jgi:hypothetical protein